MTAAILEKGYSPPVTLELHVGGEVLEVAQVGDGSLILRAPRRLPAESANIVVFIDGVRKDHPVVLKPADHEDVEVLFW